MMMVIGEKENLYPFRSDLWYMFNFTGGDESDYVFIRTIDKQLNNWITGLPKDSDYTKLEGINHRMFRDMTPKYSKYKNREIVHFKNKMDALIKASHADLR
jgi:hypothetical protein